MVGAPKTEPAGAKISFHFARAYLPRSCDLFLLILLERLLCTLRIQKVFAFSIHRLHKDMAGQFKLPADANRIVFVRHLPDSISHGELYELFGKYGAIEQIRLYVTEGLQSPLS